MYNAEVVQEGLQRRQQPWRWGAQWLAIRCWQQPNESNHWSWSSYNYMKSCQRTQHRPFYGHWHLKRIGKVEKLHQQVSHELTENQNNHYLKRLSSLILCNSNEPFLNQIVICNKKWILYNNPRWPVHLLDLQEAPKHFPKPNLHQKKVTVWWSAVGLIHYSFLNPGEAITSEKYALQTSETHWKRQHLQLRWSTERAQFFSRTMPDRMSHNQCFKNLENWAMEFCLIHHIHLTSCQLNTTSWRVLRTFCRKNTSTTSKRQKMLSKSSLNPEACIFMPQE